MSGLKWPVPERFNITQGFAGAHPYESPGYLEKDAKGPKRARRTKFADAEYRTDLHAAIDVGCPIGTRLSAPESGTVVAAGTYTSTGEHYLMLRVHRDAKRQTVCFFTHLRAGGVIVPVGARVGRGQKLAETGNSGMSTGPHLHYEVRVGPRDADPRLSGSWFKWNPKRLSEGGDLADSELVRP